MIFPTDRVVATMIGEARFGKICTLIILVELAPWDKAAKTNSRSLMVKVAPLTNRATVVQLTNETINIIHTEYMIYIAYMIYMKRNIV